MMFPSVQDGSISWRSKDVGSGEKSEESKGGEFDHDASVQRGWRREKRGRE